MGVHATGAIDVSTAGVRGDGDGDGDGDGIGNEMSELLTPMASSAATPSQALTHAVLAECPNCRFALDHVAHRMEEPLRYCPRCGQETTLHPPSVAEFMHEFVGHYVALEGALWRTLRLLVFRPGQLTAAYLGGRRREFVLPLRLYLSASFLFFLAAKLAPPDMTSSAPIGRHDTVPAAIVATASVPAMGHSSDGGCHAIRGGSCSWIEQRLQVSVDELTTDPQRAESTFYAHLLAKAPYAIFLMLPLFAGVLALVYRGQRRLFGEHMVCCMHLMSLGFFAATLAVLLPPPAGVVLAAISAVYAVRALRVVYGGRWAWTIVRSAVATAICSVLLLAALVVLALVVLLT